MAKNNICFIDFETTGINLIDDYPIEIGAIVVDQNTSIIGEFHSFSRPNNYFEISENALMTHGITKEKALSFPFEGEVLNNMFLKLGTDYRLAAWNMSFDISFFKMLCYRNNYMRKLSEINYRHIDVQTISYVAKQIGLIDNEINSFSDITDYLGMRRSLKHNALEDAKLLVEVYTYLINKLKFRSQII